MTRQILALLLFGASILAVQILILEVTCDEIQAKVPKAFDYATYVKKYGKSYDNIETLARAKLFYARTLGIFKMNMLYLSHKAQHFLGQNEYTDMTPSEVKSMFSNRDIDLIPVLEAKYSPETPADFFDPVNNDQQDNIKDGYSKASLNDLPADDEAESGSSRRKTTVNFFSDAQDQEIIKPRDLVQTIASHPKISEKLSHVIDVKSKSDTDGAELYRKLNGISYVPMIKPENKNYDPSLVPSFAWSDDVDRATDNFASYMMEDFLGHLEPYPMPKIPSRKVLKDEDLPPAGPGVLSEFMGSIKTFYDYFSKEDDAVIVNPNKNELDKEQADETSPVNEHINQGQQIVDETMNRTVLDVDWRKTGCISRPKFQSKCNACYAFATLDLMEFFYCRQKKKSTEFSVQYIVDCGHKSNLNGCQGGKLSNVGLFIQKHGLQMNAAYPYNAREQECPYGQSNDDDDDERKSWAFKPTISGWRMFPEIQAWYKWLPKSPIIVGINMPSDFFAYAGGVHDGADCNQEMVHAMLLVGSGKENGKSFWLLKNTFAETWGEAGYFKLSKKAPIKCFNSAIVARANFND